MCFPIVQVVVTLLSKSKHQMEGLTKISKTAIIALNDHVFEQKIVTLSFSYAVVSMEVYAQVWINKNVPGKIVNIFLPISFNICFGCSKEPSH